MSQNFFVYSVTPANGGWNRCIRPLIGMQTSQEVLATVDSNVCSSLYTIMAIQRTVAPETDTETGCGKRRNFPGFW
jgi:hypothetical protein